MSYVRRRDELGKMRGSIRFVQMGMWKARNEQKSQGIDFDQERRLVSTGIAFVARYARSLCLKIVGDSGERERLCRLMKPSLGKGRVIEDIMWKDNGYSAV